MAGSIIQRSSEREREREMARRPDYSYDYGPFSLMRRFSEEMDQFFHNAFGRSQGGSPTAWSPAVDVRERDGKIEVVAELPGIKKEDVRLEVRDEGLILEGEKHDEREETSQGIHRVERSYGHFYRMIPLPQGAQADQAKAEFKDGLLTVRIPLAESKQRSRSIPIGS
jgi:HSP20 family protein